MDHHRYETDLRLYLEEYLEEQPPQVGGGWTGTCPDTIAELHQEYLSASGGGMNQDVRYILEGHPAPGGRHVSPPRFPVDSSKFSAAFSEI